MHPLITFTTKSCLASTHTLLSLCVSDCTRRWSELTGFQKGVAIPDFDFDISHYAKARDKLGLALLQDVHGIPAGYPEFRLPESSLGGGKDTSSFNQIRFVKLAAG